MAEAKKVGQGEAGIKRVVKLQQVFDVVHMIRKNLGVTSVQHLEVLLNVMAQEGQSQIELGTTVDLTQAQMAMTIARMRDKGLIDDYIISGRTKAVDLTPKARRLRDKL
jgi:DNA-binding MarR family transcriptional regulator